MYKVWLGGRPASDCPKEWWPNPLPELDMIQEIGEDGWLHSYALIERPMRIYKGGGAYMPRTNEYMRGADA